MGTGTVKSTRGLPVPITRFIKSCRQKAQWINAAITFGIDIQDIFRIGIRSDVKKMATDNDFNNDNDENENMYYFHPCESNM
jgi:hypothetical protein